ncbi:MAG: hypothetical protein ACFB0G_11350 [Leptolyngbyaceae cyanobacterium]
MKFTLYPSVPATAKAPKPVEVVKVAGVDHVRAIGGALISIE